MIKKNIIDKIGNTNLIYLERLSIKYSNNIYMKDESTNPFGSIKDRPALYMIKKAIEEGKINKDTLIVEATSGNTGIGLAGVCMYYGLKLVIVMPSNASIERVKIMKAYNADVRLTNSKLGMQGSIDLALTIMKENPNSYMPSQFENENNYLSHYETTAAEINNDLNVDIICCGIGTSGTITGIGKYFKENKPNVKIIGVEPFESAVLNNKEKGQHGIDGIGAGFIPSIYNKEYVDEVLDIKTDEAYLGMKELMQEEALFVGISTGAAFKGVIKYIEKEKLNNKNVVFISPDSGVKYLSKL